MEGSAAGWGSVACDDFARMSIMSGIDQDCIREICPSTDSLEIQT